MARLETEIKGGDCMNEQMSIFDMLRNPLKIEKPIRLISLFS